MNDLEFIDHYIEKCKRFVNPTLLYEAQRRGLLKYLNYLPQNPKEAKGIVRARLSADGKFFDDPEIDMIAGDIERLKKLKIQLDKVNLADADETLPILEEMVYLSKCIMNYYK